MLPVTKLLLDGKIGKAIDLGKDTAKLTGEVAADAGRTSVKVGKHVYRHKDKYTYGAVGAAAGAGALKATQAIKKAFTSKD